MPQSLLEVENIHTFYDDCPILKDLCLKVDKGSVVALLGRNGMGKTTTIRSIIGLTPPRQGSITFKGTKIAGFAADKIARMGMGFVPQGRYIFPSLTVKENILIAERSKKNGSRWTLEKIYDLFPVLRERANSYGTVLSGGEQQMLALARALMTNPDLLLLDEPSEGLAPIIINKIAGVIKEIQAEGTSILVVEQNLRFSLDISDHIYIISSGQVVHQFTTTELQHNAEIKTKYLGVSRS